MWNREIAPHVGAGDDGEAAGASAPPEVAAAIAAAYGALPAVTAVALAGSWATGATDDRSDLDLYVYAAEPLAIAERATIAAGFATQREVGYDFWEPGDEWIDAETGIHVDVMFRTPAWIEAQLERVLVRHEASVGYSTCFWCNVLHSVALADPDGWYRGLQASATRPYPEPLRRAIVAKNHPLLRHALPSYLGQIERAVRRGDGVSVQHRVTALLASYFDVLFAVNRLPHPGEKRLLAFAATRCATAPRGMVVQVHAVLETAAHPPTSAVVERITAILDGLDTLLADEQLLPRAPAST